MAKRHDIRSGGAVAGGALQRKEAGIGIVVVGSLALLVLGVRALVRKR